MGYGRRRSRSRRRRLHRRSLVTITDDVEADITDKKRFVIVPCLELI